MADLPGKWKPQCTPHLFQMLVLSRALEDGKEASGMAGVEALPAEICWWWEPSRSSFQRKSLASGGDEALSCQCVPAARHPERRVRRERILL